MQIIQNRRDFLASLSVAGAAGVLGARASLADEGPPETTTIRLLQDPNICVAPGYIAEDLLRAEGFTEIRYVPCSVLCDPVARSRKRRLRYDRSDVCAVIVCPGCRPTAHCVGGRSFRMLRALRARAASGPSAISRASRIAIRSLGYPGHCFVSIMAAQVGLDPQTDIEWVDEFRGASPMELFVDGKVDAFLGFPPEPQELRARKIGRVILDTATDRPWSQYLCCIVFG